MGRQYEAIVIGTSAGGLFALTTLLEQLPKNYPIPLIITQHRSKDYKDLLEEVLQSKCQILIKQADEKETILSERVYVAPPGYHLLVEEDYTFSLSADENVSYSKPSIDVLFETAAEAYREKLVGILLTGANSDGASGMSVIRKNKGLTIAQSPTEAQYPAMPQAAIDRKAVDHIWVLKEIRDFIVQLPARK